MNFIIEWKQNKRMKKQFCLWRRPFFFKADQTLFPHRLFCFWFISVVPFPIPVPTCLSDYCNASISTCIGHKIMIIIAILYIQHFLQHNRTWVVVVVVVHNDVQIVIIQSELYVSSCMCCTRSDWLADRLHESSTIGVSVSHT